MARCYTLFRIRDVLHAVEATIVQEVFRLPATTPVPQAPPWVTGIVNLRGELVVAVDPAIWLGFPRRAPVLDDVVILLKRGEQRLGIVVDEVLEVLEIPDQETESIRDLLGQDPPGAPRERRLARRGEQVISILGPDEIFGLTTSVAPDGLADGLAATGEPFGEPVDQDAERQVFLERARSLAQWSDDQEPEGRAAVAVVSWSDELYGVSLESIREFADVGPVARVPCCPPHVLGLVNLRGEILTLLDIRGALRILLGGVRSWSKMMVVEVGDLRAGVVVDGILDLLHVRASEIGPLPYAASGMARDHLLGTVRYEGRMLSLLDLGGLLARDEWLVQTVD